MQLRKTVTALLALALLAGAPLSAGKAGKKKKNDKNPDVVTVQHVLVSFEGRLGNKPVERTKKEAEELAWEIFDRAEAGEDFDALVKQYTDDSHPGIYTMTNRGAARLPDTWAREDMAVSFGDVAFKLDVGEVGVARFNPELSPFGWHVIKRLE